MTSPRNLTIAALACALCVFAVDAKTTAEKWRDKSLPAIFAAWSLPSGDRATMTAKHDLYWNTFYSFGTPEGLGETLTPASVASGKARIAEILAQNPNCILLQEVRWADYWDNWLPADHIWWKRDANGNRTQIWPGAYETDRYNPAFQDHVAKRAAALVKDGGLDGVMLDWKCDNEIVDKVRAAIGPDAIICVNTNGAYHPKDQLVNAIFSEGNGGASRSEMETIERWEKNSLFPGIWCAETFGADTWRAKEGATRMATFTNGYYLLATVNSTSAQHAHPWYDEWNTEIGKAMAPPLGLGEDLWMRQCENGVSVYNKGDSTAAIIFDVPYVRSSDKSQATSFRISQCDDENGNYYNGVNPGAYDLFSRTGSPAVAPRPETIYEAEASSNTLSGTTAASGEYVTNIGGSASNGLTIPVIATTAGTHIMKMTYTAGGVNQVFKVRVNTQKVLRFICRTAGTTQSPGNECYLVKLSEGVNEIKFYNDNGSSPNLNKISIAYCGYLATWSIPYSTAPNDNTPPSAPGQVSATPVNAHQIDLTWTAATDGESGIGSYFIYRGTQKAGESSVLSFSDKGLTEGTVYAYSVSAVNGAGLEGPKSAAASATTPADHTGPKIQNVTTNGRTQLMVVFDEPVEQSSAQNAGNYAITSGVTVSAASLGADLKTATLTTSAMTGGMAYQLTVNNVRDRANSPNTIALDSRFPFQFQDALTRIRFYPRSGYANRMQGGVFEGTNGNKDSGTYSVLYAISTQPSEGEWTEVTSLSATQGFRYVRYRSPDNSYGNVAEIEFYRGTQKVAGDLFGTPGSFGNSGNDYAKAFDGNTATYWDYTQGDGAYAGMDLSGGATAGPGAIVVAPASIRSAAVLLGNTLAIPAGRYTLTIMDLTGKLVSGESGVGPAKRDLSLVLPGVYVVRLAGKGRSTAGRIVVR